MVESHPFEPTDKYEYVPELLYVWLFQLKELQELIDKLEDVGLFIIRSKFAILSHPFELANTYSFSRVILNTVP